MHKWTRIQILSSTCNWGEPERAPHRSVVDVGGTSVACPTIYDTYTVDVGGTSVACPTMYDTYTVDVGGKSVASSTIYATYKVFD